MTDRKVDPGQTVAAQFQTPVLFVVAPDLEKKVYVYASVDEADIGLIREAQKRAEPVMFTVDAYPKDIFQGKIAQVRLNWTTVQNVVTYTVIVESANPELKLLPGHDRQPVVSNREARRRAGRSQRRLSLLSQARAGPRGRSGRSWKPRRPRASRNRAPTRAHRSRRGPATSGTSGCSTETCWPPCRS